MSTARPFRMSAAPPPAPSRWSWRRFDTLFMRLFVLMWLTLVISHVAAFLLVTTRPGGPQPGPGGAMPLPTFPSLPPGNPFTAESATSPPILQPGGPGHRPFGVDRPPPPPGHGGAMPFAAPPSGRAEPGPRPLTAAGQPALPRNDLWLDYAVRLFIIALGAWLGARWLARPMQRLSAAAVTLSQSFGRAAPAPVPLDEHQGTLEVREAARVFNQMAQQLQQQFDARGLHMAAVSHDLRTPLTRLRMRLARWPDLAEQQAAVADIHEMDELIGDTLAVLREQHDGSQARPVDVGAFLQALVDDLQDQGLAVDCTPPAQPLRVRVRPVALRRILGNLAGNAVRHGGSAHLAAQVDEGRVHITVDDLGPGIAPEQLARVFEPWVRLSDAEVPGMAGGPQVPNPSRSGHGLGLAIARDLAERDGGEVSLHNRAEGGLRARLSLPQA